MKEYHETSFTNTILKVIHMQVQEVPEDFIATALYLLYSFSESYDTTMPEMAGEVFLHYYRDKKSMEEIVEWFGITPEKVQHILNYQKRLLSRNKKILMVGLPQYYLSVATS